MDPNTVVAVTSILTLVMIAVGGLVGVLWGKVGTLSKQLTDYRVKAAESYITIHEMDRRLEQAIAPLERMLEKMESQNNKIFSMMSNHYREVG